MASLVFVGESVRGRKDGRVEHAFGDVFCASTTVEFASNVWSRERVGSWDAA